MYTYTYTYTYAHTPAAFTSSIFPTDRAGTSDDMGAILMALLAAGILLSVSAELLKNSIDFTLLLLMTTGMKT